MNDNEFYSVCWKYATIIAVTLILSVTSCQTYKIWAFTVNGYVEQNQPGSNEARWVKPMAPQPQVAR